MFITNRLNLRPFAVGDSDLLLKMWNTEPVQLTITNEYIVPRPPKYKEELEKWINETTFFVIIETKDKNEFMGFASLKVGSFSHRDSLYGIGLLPEFWNKGYGTEVTKFVVDYTFVSLGVHRVSLNVFGCNQGAIAVYKKIGFIEEGRKRKSIWMAGRWEDNIIMGILEDEWEALKKLS
ncbi:gnat family [Moniliophthora roreri MCA 2997]|uniref:Gnat family n=1 Tax=Moniliophthora roreri (strain MCA 2997) TaxID=1381753 RepID=V2YTH4_MONRO|nr:gnat family [Moniliophthora roreri MCA 2997]KAI3607656.1 gnat family [Moniliophthora roreri]